MLVALALIFIVLVLAGLGTLIALDVTRSGFAWISTLKEWQQLMGTVVGFLGAAGVLVLGLGFESAAEQERAQRAARAIGTALAYEAERLAVAFELGRQFGAEINFEKADLGAECVELARAMQQVVSSDTPVFDSGLQQLIDFGDRNLSLFVRFYAFYKEFARTVSFIDSSSCGDAAREQIAYMVNQIEIGRGYYGFIAEQYDIVAYSAAEGFGQ